MGLRKSLVIFCFLVYFALSNELNYNFEIPQPPSDDYYYDFSHYSDYGPEYYADAGSNAETTTQRPTTTTKTTDLIFKKIEFNLTANKTKSNLESESATLTMDNKTVFVVAFIAVAFIFVLIGVGVFMVVRLKAKKNKNSHESTTIDKNQYISVNQTE